MSPPPKSSCTVYIARSAQLQLLSDYWWPSQWPASPYPRSWLLWTISAFACPYFRYHNLHSNHSRYLNNLKVEAKFYGRVRATKTLETVPLCENFSSTSTVYNMQCKSTASCIVMLLTKNVNTLLTKFSGCSTSLGTLLTFVGTARLNMGVNSYSASNRDPSWIASMILRVYSSFILFPTP